MEISENLKKEFIRKLYISRTRILCNHPFFGLLLMHMNFRLDEELETAATDGENIIFGVEFLQGLTDKELDFVMMHEILHVALTHCFRGQKYSHDAFNVACDIVVNSTIMHENGDDLSSITLRNWGVSMHLAPDGKEGYNYSAEEVYEMLPKSIKSPGGKRGDGDGAGGSGFDDHGRWKDSEGKADGLEEVWEKRVENAAKAVEIRESALGCGNLPLFARRLLKELKDPLIDWRTILNDFVSEEVVDYSFSPPDKRYGDGDFFLPDFNDTDITPKKILFMIDTSGSMSDDMVTRAYSEVKGAIDRFDGKLQGYLGFFDAAVVQPAPFTDEESFKVITPIGGGGTNFSIIFKFVKDYMADDLPASIIILTDGYAPFPEENAAMDIPVLWVINNEEVTPPWGKIARIK